MYEMPTGNDAWHHPALRQLEKLKKIQEKENGTQRKRGDGEATGAGRGARCKTNTSVANNEATEDTKPV
jgi:hypothetical protein